MGNSVATNHQSLVNHCLQSGRLKEAAGTKGPAANHLNRREEKNYAFASVILQSVGQSGDAMPHKLD